LKKKKWRAFFAAVAASMMLALQMFPFVVVAQVPALNPPKLEAPQWETPQWDVPNPEIPLQQPQWDTPQLEAPNGVVPDLQAPNGEVPNLQAPDGNTRLNGPNISPPGSGGSSNTQVPQLNPPQLPGRTGSNSNADSSFLDSPGYDAMKFSFKDVFGGTLGYSAGLILEGEVDLRTALTGKGLFMAGLGIKGLHTGFEDTKFGTLTGLGVDAFDGWAAWDSYHILMQQNAGLNVAEARTFKYFSNTQSAASTIKVPGLVAGLNVAAASISLPFDALDTWKDFSEVFDPSLSEDKQNEKFVDGVGNLGSTLMDAGVIATVIPGGQAAAMPLFIAGAVLWGISKLVKYGDKLSGGAITRGIRKGVKKAFGWLKSVFT